MKNLTFEQFLKSDLENHTNYYSCGKKKFFFCKYEDGSWETLTYDQNGNCTKYENSEGFWNKSTYDQDGNEKTFEDSDGEKRGFEPKEEELSLGQYLFLLKQKGMNQICIDDLYKKAIDLKKEELYNYFKKYL